MGHISKEVVIGVLTSIVATLCGLFIYLEFISDDTMAETFKKVIEGGVLGPVLALAAIPNLFVFWVFLKKNQDYRARGVLMTTIVVALITLVLKFI
ncbi:hypothetical protein RRF68_11510 [Tenacibaculum sp. HL-MS23]|uniref:hypothetical protein n=1 Tax=Tenacibaculum sp. HL-MS23 TaxID=3077734 RepID=UPI0028FC217D|nr:hypothetical protein [Tenacibaculum sp. HL-MS23]WNW01609.1 hypothetical protein RRF68_11510 [Tenacibaculum sp. HL-MS23]